MQFDEIAEGAALPELAFPITASAIAVAAMATMDYEDVHHDKAAAQSKGVPDIFMNILTTNGVVQRYVGEWAGPRARMKKIAIKLGAPNFVGDTMKLNGSVTRRDAAAREIDVVVSGRNQIGEHVGATVTLHYPQGDAA